MIHVFFVGLSVMLYPTISDYVNQRSQSRAVASYAQDVDNMTDADHSAYFDAADAFNAQVAANENALYRPDQLSGYNETLDITGTGIMGYITISKIGVELPIYHGTGDSVLQIAAGHLEGTSLPVGGASTHAVISAHRGPPSAKFTRETKQNYTPTPYAKRRGAARDKKERGFFHEKSNEETHGCTAGSCHGVRHGDPGVCIQHLGD